VVLPTKLWIEVVETPCGDGQPFKDARAVGDADESECDEGAEGDDDLAVYVCVESVKGRESRDMVGGESRGILDDEMVPRRIRCLP